MSKEYKHTLNLPKTSFPMRANAAQREPSFQKFWKEKDVYNKNLNNRSKGSFILHDGPPYLSGSKIHIGHALNRILKDIVVKYKTLNGYASPLIFGYDCHGLPIEHEVSKKLGKKRHEMPPTSIRRACKEFALKNLKGQEENFYRLGLLGNWETRYLTLNPTYEAAQLSVFAEMVDKGYIYKGRKSISWCTNCETALAEAEVEYRDKKSSSIYVKMRLIEGQEKLPEALQSKNINFIIWTTTPWTLPANLGIALNPGYEYVFVEVGQEVWVLSQGLKDKFLTEVGQEGTVLATLKGSELEGLKYQHPFYERQSPIVLGNHVTNETGTGCVHTAPGHGLDDFYVGQKYNLGMLCPINNRGIFNEEAPQFEGMYYAKGNAAILELIESNGSLVYHSEIEHSYPHCWRCKNPIVFRATEQWFASVDGFRDNALNAIKNISWLPTAGESRISNMIAERTDWCISRQRVWGVPIPAFYCQNRHTILNKELITHVKNLVAEKGSDIWFELEASELMPSGYQCPECKSSSFVKETDTMDVWFDSGTSHTAVLNQYPELQYPADLYLEGSDQHRGWFQSSLLTAMAAHETPPYKMVITHGFALDGNGRKMSKSVGNVVAPQEVISKYGADVLRLWVASVDYTDDVRISDEILKQLAEVYKKIRNTARFMISNLYDFAPSDQLNYEDLSELDRYTLNRIQNVIQQVRDSFDSFAFYQFYQIIQNFCVLDLSNFYFAIVKDILYIEKADSQLRRGVQTVLWEGLQSLTKMIAPVLTHLAEDIWQNLPEALKESQEESILTTDYPEANDKFFSEELEKKWQSISTVKDVINAALENARNQKMIGKSLEAKVSLYVDNQDIFAYIKANESLFRQVFIVSDLTFPDIKHDEDEATSSDHISVVVRQAQGEKCQRCWNVLRSVGKHETHPTLCERCIDVVDSFESIPAT